MRPPRVDAPKRTHVRKWQIDFATFGLVEQGQERRPGGRVDHTLTYERAAPALNEGRYRVRLVVSGDRLTEVTHFIRIPEAFTRRYQNMRSANEAIGIASVVGMMLLYVVGGIGVGLFYMLRSRWVLWRPAAAWGVVVGLLQALATVNEWPLMWMTYDTAVPRATFLGQQIATVVAMFAGFSIFFAPVVHGGGDPDTARVRIASPVLARLEEGAGQLEDDPRTDGGGVPARVDLLRLRRPALPDRDARVRLVDAVGSPAAPGRARDARAMAVGHRELAAGGLLVCGMGGSAVGNWRRPRSETASPGP